MKLYYKNLQSDKLISIKKSCPLAFNEKWNPFSESEEPVLQPKIICIGSISKRDAILKYSECLVTIE